MEITGNPMRLHENAMTGNTAADMAANIHLHANITQHNLTQHNITEEDINLCTLEDLKAAGFSGLSLSKLRNAIHKDPITKKEFQQYVNDSKTKHNPMGYLYDAILNHYRPL